MFSNASGRAARGFVPEKKFKPSPTVRLPFQAFQGFWGFFEEDRP
jgi:hypothetical protein